MNNSNKNRGIYETVHNMFGMESVTVIVNNDRDFSMMKWTKRSWNQTKGQTDKWDVECKLFEVIQWHMWIKNMKPLKQENNSEHIKAWIKRLPFCRQYYQMRFLRDNVWILSKFPDSKVLGVNMGPTWVLAAPDGPHVGPMNLAMRVFI